MRRLFCQDEREECGTKNHVELLFKFTYEWKVENIQQKTLMALQLLIPIHYLSNVI